MEILLHPQKDKTIRNILLEKNIITLAPCGGNGICGKCKIKLLKGETFPKADDDGFVLACHTVPLTDCVFEIFPMENAEEKNIECKYAEYAVCDVGTTNIKIKKFSAHGVEVFSCSLQNPQATFGADVISRISACKSGMYLKQTEILRSSISTYIKDVKVAYFCGNPTMMHFLAGIDPSPIGVYPFKCVFKDMRVLSTEETLFPCKAVLLPSVSAYVGSDALCGIYAALNEKQNILIADIGTNGEISLIKGEKIYSATTAAGPAIEGAGIEMGVCGGEGAIFAVKADGTPCYTGDEAIGITGGGLVSLLSYLLKTEKMSREGRLCCDKYYVTEKIYITQKDVTEFMLAKSAVRTAINLLLNETCTNYRQIEKFILTGGLGNYLNVDDAVSTGLLPLPLKEKTVFIPDLASLGASEAISKKHLDFLGKLSQKVDVLSLSENEKFEEEFAWNLFF